MTDTASSSVILDADLLSDSHVPENLVGREKQVAELGRWLSAAVMMKTPTHIWLHGPSGAGKTATTLNVINRLQDEHGVEIALINCWEHGTYFEVLDALVSEFRILRAEEHRSSLKLEKVRKHLNEKPCIIVVDEVDRMRPLERAATLYNLTKLGMVSLVCISDDERALHGLDERVRSRLSPHTIPFQRYRLKELLRLLRDRASRAIAPRAAPERAMREIAAIAEGDARVAIRLLRNAAAMAEQQGLARISARHLTEQKRRMSQARAASKLQELAPDHRILFDLVAKQREITSGDLRQAYLNQCEQIQRKPLAARTFSKYINTLVRMGLIVSERARVKGRVRLLKVVG